jgi:hypothetical protein
MGRYGALGRRQSRMTNDQTAVLEARKLAADLDAQARLHPEQFWSVYLSEAAAMIRSFLPGPGPKGPPPNMGSGGSPPAQPRARLKP